LSEFILYYHSNQALFGGFFLDSYDMKVLVSRYQSIDMHCIVVPVKFDDGLSISFRRRKQTFTKKGGLKVYIFKKRYNFQNYFELRRLEEG
jgi:hypothetical protein